MEQNRDIVFGLKWFEKHQTTLLWLLNNDLTKRWFRWVMRIRLEDCPFNEKITNIKPSNFSYGEKLLLTDKGLVKEITTDFRTHDKYAKRLYFAFKPLWYLMHAFDWAMLDRVEALAKLSFGFSTLTVYPASGTAVDGKVERSGVSESWATIRAGAGNAFDANPVDSQFVSIKGDVSPNYIHLKRSIFLFDTSALTAAATITAATMSLRGNYKQNPNSDSVTINIYSSTPGSNTTLANSDYGQIGSTAQCDTAITYAGYTTSGYNDFLFNATGRGNISKTGISKFGAREATYDVGGTTPSGGINCQPIMGGLYSGQTGTTQDPKLVITYTAPVPTDVTKSLKYTIKTVPSALTKSLRYAIKVVSAPTKSLVYKIKVPVAVNKSLKYTLKITVAAITKSLRYLVLDVSAPIQKSLKYTLKITPSAKTKSSQYAIKVISTKTKSLQYEIKSLAAITKALKYTLKITVAAMTKSLRYAVKLTPSAITKGLIYKVKASVAVTKSLKYTLLAHSSPIQKSLKYTIFTQPGTLPNKYSGLLLWLKADSLALSDGDPVSTWGDDSGNSNNATAAGTARPTFKTNQLGGKPVVRFDGSNDGLNFASSLSTILTVIVVIKYNIGAVVNSYPPILGHTSFYDFHGSPIANPPSVTGVCWISYTNVYVQGADAYNNGVSMFGNQIMRDFSNYQLVEFLTTGPVHSDRIGNDRGGSFIAADYAEVIIYDNVLSTAKRKSIERYLAYKYGLIVSGNGFTKKLQYAIKQVFAITKSIRYAVKPKVDITKSAKYTVKAPASTTRSLKYEVTTGKSINKSLQYAVKTSGHQNQKSLRYAVTTKSFITKSITYAVTTEILENKSLQYAVATKGEITKTLQYEVISIEAITKGLSYRIRIPAMLKTMTYMMRIFPYHRKQTPYTKKESPYHRLPGG